jgi:site-specific DNA-methyltransferase (adenine-specific)
MKLVKISEVKPNPKNPRIIKDGKFQKLIKSIQEFPDMLNKRPLIVFTDVDNKYVVLGGNMRLKACKEIGLKEIPIIIADEWTEEQKNEFLIKDNVGFGEWDWDSLANEWDAEKLTDWGLDLPVDLSVQEELEAEEDNYEMPNEIETDIVLGDLFEIGEHRLLCGDSTQVDTWQKVMNEKLCDMVMTDPPYNIDYEGKTKDALTIQNDNMSNSSFYQFLYDFYTALGSYTKKGGAWYVFHASTETVNFSTAMINSGLLLKQYLVWVKNTMVLGRQDYQWKHELCLYGWKEGAAHYFTNERTHTTVIEDTINVNKLTKDEMKKMLTEMLSDKTKSTIIHCDKPHRSAEHPTMKPILLLAPLIQNSSKENEIVADGFLGSGSTMVASHQLKRKCYGMELDPKYCQVIIERMKKLDPSLIIKKNGVELK